MTNFTPNTSPLSSHRPSGRLGLTTQRNSISPNRRKGIKLCPNANKDRSKSPVEGRLKGSKPKNSLERMSDLDKGIFRSRGSSKSKNTALNSPVHKDIRNSANIGSMTSQAQSGHDCGVSPSKNIIRLGKRNSIT